MGWGKETKAITLHYDTLNTEIFFKFYPLYKITSTELLRIL